MTGRYPYQVPLHTAGFLCVLAALAFFFLGAALSPAAGERFDFLATSRTLGFGQPHNAEIRAEAGKPLLVRATDKDPYFHSPALSLRATTHGVLLVRAAFEGPVRRLGFFFATDKSPNISPDKMLSIPIRADGKEYEYRLPIGSHPKWQGTVTRYRFDLDPGESGGAVMRLSSVAYVYPADPALNQFTASASVLSKGTTASLTVEIENAAPDPVADIEVRFEPSANAISVSPARVAVARLAPDERRSVQVVVRGERDGVAVLDAIMLRKGVELDRRPLAICVLGEAPSPGPPGRAIQPRVTDLNQPAVSPAVIDDPALFLNYVGENWSAISTADQALTVGLRDYSGLAEWWARDGTGHVRVGRIFPLVSVLHGEKKRRLDVVRWRSSESQPLVLFGEVGQDGETIGYVTVLLMLPQTGENSISVVVVLSAKRPIHLRAFMSPRLLVGDGAFGAERDEGLFPGVEYLEKGERSSSKLDYHTDEYLRTVPHPKKITTPLMAVTHRGRLFTLDWDNPKPDGDGLLAPSAGFASPNFVDGQQNHLMALFWPSVPDDVAENEWEARKPVVLKPGDRLALSYRLNVQIKPGIHVAEAVRTLVHDRHREYSWSGPGPTSLYDRYDGIWWPCPTWPRDNDAERALCRLAYTDVIWREKERGWNHALPASPTQWQPYPYTFNLQFLESERSEMTSSPERSRISTIIEQAAAHRWEIGGQRPSGEDYYFVGETLLGCIEARQAQARSLMRQQRADGSWDFDARDEQRAQLGEKGQAEIGIVADHAIPILQYALLTGDPDAEAAARKALENMKRYVIPRAAQVWEIPVHTPDIMGSARGATACRLGYLLTGETEYLDRAKYWLATGWPFVYSWGHRPYWLGATIPVFGATFFRAPNWEGLPVQWCGLVYAEEDLRRYLLWMPSRFIPAPNERPVGHAIVGSAMWQQPTEGEYRGLLPDSYAFAAKQGNPPFINPETILRPLWLMRGFDFRVNSVVVPRGADRSLRLSALARLSTATLTADRSVSATLSAVRGLPFGVAVCGLTAAPLEVKWHSQSVPKRDKLERAQEGWQYLPDRGWLLANLIGTGKEDRMVLRLAGK